MKSEITRVCIVDTVYTLFIYLLYSSEEELNRTFYFFSNGIARSVREKFDKYYFFDKKIWIHKNFFSYIFLFSFFLFRYFQYPFLRKAEIFGHDHLFYSPFVIGKRDYTYIEDGPKVLSTLIGSKYYKDFNEFWNSKRFSIKKLVPYFISGVYRHSTANNKQCKAVILTIDDNVPYIAGKTKHLINLNNTWENISNKKKDYILDVYNITQEDINALQSRTHILLTQQFSSDDYISEAEQIEIYKQIIEKYDASCLIIKSHPRDSVDYRKYFPGIFVFDKPIPMQLLLLIGGLNFKKAITVCSSSINMFPDYVEKEWIGSAVHPELYKIFPNLDHNIYV